MVDPTRRLVLKDWCIGVQSTYVFEFFIHNILKYSDGLSCKLGNHPIPVYATCRCILLAYDSKSNLSKIFWTIPRFLDPSLKVFGMMLWGILQNTAGSNHNLPKNVLQMYSDIWLPDFDSEKWLSSLLSIRLNWKKSLKISIISIGKISHLTKICMRNVFDALLNYVLHSTKVGSNYIFFNFNLNTMQEKPCFRCIGISE